MIPNFLKNLFRRRKRYLRHGISLLRYSTFYKLRNLARVEWENFRKRERVSGLPYITVLDPTNVCNLKCPVCPTTRAELLQPSGRIATEKFQELVDRIAAHTYRLILYNWGEPFLHRQIISLITYAHQKRISTSISSNLNLLPREGAEALVLSGLDDLVVSCDGLSQETYQRYRVGGELAKVVTNLNAIRDAKKTLGRSNPSIEFQFLVFQHNEHEVEQVYDFALRNGADTVRLVRPVLDLNLPSIKAAADPAYVRPEYLALQTPLPLTDQNQDDVVHASASDQPQQLHQNDHEKTDASSLLSPIHCYWPWRVLTVSWNGEIDPCCYNNQLGSFGNIFDQPVIDLMNGEKFVYARNRIAGRASPDGFDDVICKTCDGYNF